jgi:putative nucleotidyltransferase with HDIG domain
MIVEEEIVSPESIAYHRLNLDLAEAFKHLHTRFWTRSVLITLVAALVTCLGPLSYAFLTHSNKTKIWLGDFGTAAVAAFASGCAILGMYPLLRKGEQYLRETASIISHANIELLSLLGTLTELRGGDTAGHALRVTVYTMLFAEGLQLPREMLLRTVKGALLHDIGKLVIPDRIICKPGTLTREERAEMEHHVLRGLEIVEQSELLNAAVNVVEFHHERYDGGGYPHRLQGEKIPLEARLFALVDVFDALTASRAYKPALSVAEALHVMAEERGSHFDPYLFDRFVEMAPYFERKMPRGRRELKAMLLAGLTPYLDVSEISYLRRRLLAVGKDYLPLNGRIIITSGSSDSRTPQTPSGQLPSDP